MYPTLSELAGVSTLVTVSLVTLITDRKCTIPLVAAVLLVLPGAMFITQPEVIFNAHSKIVYNPVCTKDTQPPLNETWGESEMNTREFTGFSANFVTVISELTTKLSSASAASPWSSSSSSAPNQVIGCLLAVGASISLAAQSYIVNKKLSDLHYSLVNFCVRGTRI